VNTLHARLALGFSLLAAASVLALSLAANLFLESRFAAYVGERIAAEKDRAVQDLAAAWSAAGAWNHEQLGVLGMDLLEKGLVLRVADAAGAVVWDARTHNNGLCEQMIATMARRMDSRYLGWTGTYREDARPMTVAGPAGDATVGTVWIGYYGPFWFNDAELYFLSSLNQLVALVAAGVIAAAALAGWLLAGHMARPIREVTATAHRLRAGELEARSTARSGIREIGDLAASVNALGRELSEQEALRRRLTSDVSHELRTPLASLRGQLEAMMDGIWLADRQRLEDCHAEVGRLTRLVGQIEGLARAESATQLDLAEIGLVAFIDRLCSSQAAAFRERSVEFSWRADEGSFFADADKLCQILVNLLSNAARYTPAGGQVRLEAAFRAPAGPGGAGGRRELVVVVRDTGTGIPAADLPRIFERFYRVDPSRAAATGGAGIGLTIALALARLHSGTIEVDSREGAGSEFRLVLPA
jgi:signal transduction histidine kinase